MSDEMTPTTGSKSLELSLRVADVSEEMFLADLVTRAHPETHRIELFRKLAVLDVLGVDVVSGISPIDMWLSKMLTENNVAEEDAGEVVAFIALRSPAAGFCFWLTDQDLTDDLINEFLTYWPIAKAQYTALFPTAPIGELIGDLENYWSVPSDDILQ